MHSMDDDPQLMSKFSSDGEESFVSRPEASRRPVSRGKAQNLASQDRVANERGAEEGSGTGYRHTSKPGSRPRPPTLLGRLTSKLRIHSPPNSPPLLSPYFYHLSPTNPNITPESKSFADRKTFPHERGGFLSPKDLSGQEREQERYLATIPQSDIDERDGDQKRTTASKRIQVEWEARNRGLINSVNIPSRPPRPKGAIYPAVLATPQFGRSKSMPDIAKPMKKQEEVEIGNQPRLPTSAAPAALRPLQTPPYLRPPINDENPHLAPSPTSPLSAQWPRPPPNRCLPPIPTNVDPAPSPLMSPIIISSSSSGSSGRNSFITASPFTPMSQGFTLNVPSTPTSPGSRRGGEDSFEREIVDKVATSEIAGYPVRGLTYDGVSLTVNSHALSDESSQVESTAVRSDKDVVPSFSVVRPKRREQRETKDVQTVQVLRRPRTADPPRPKTSESTSSSQGKSQRRKSFVGQSLHNLRKSVTDSIKGRPRASATPSSPGLLAWKYDVSQLPPSPTLPLPPFSTSEFNRLGPLGINARH